MNSRPTLAQPCPPTDDPNTDQPSKHSRNCASIPPVEPLQHGGFPHLVERGGCRRGGNGDWDGEEEEIVVPDLDGRLYKVSEAGDFEDMGVTVMELV